MGETCICNKPCRRALRLSFNHQQGRAQPIRAPSTCTCTMTLLGTVCGRPSNTSPLTLPRPRTTGKNSGCLPGTSILLHEWRIYAFFMFSPCSTTTHVNHYDYRIDADTVKSTFRHLGQMFLTMLATFESRDFLKPDSEVKSLGMVMALYLSLAEERRQYFESGDDGQPNFSRFDHYVLAYAKNYRTKLQGPSKTDEFVKAIEEDEDDEIKPPALLLTRVNGLRLRKLMPKSTVRFP
ncbi:hypothetical protein BDV10DRAFT_25525 [Aspergillus recurvatus]